MSSTTQVNFQINIADNATNVVKQLSENIKGLNITTNSTSNIFKQSFGTVAVVFNQFSQVLQGFSDNLKQAIQPGIDFDKSLQDLSAITGVTGSGLKEIGGYAQDVAKQFGVDASQSVESFKLILSQLTPELGKSPAVMKKMGEDIAVLSKTMGGDTTAAAQVLTTAMNQYSVSMDNPIQAEKEMSKMMNVMAAAAKEGSAELPAIKDALENCGMAAKTAGVSFEETNAAIQVLDKAGKKGAEGGIALRNVMTILAQGRFLPEDTQKALKKAGINLKELTDRSKTLQEKMAALRPVMDDQALLTKMFGRENTAAAIALIQNSDAIGEYKSKITGTNTAIEQAKIVMQSYEERQKRVNARFTEMKIKLFDATGGMSMWMSTVTTCLVPISQMIPLIKGFGSSIVFLVSKMKLVIPALRMIRTFTISSFAQIATVAKISCRAIGTAIKNIPIIGWIAAVIALLAGLFIYFWNTSVKFRATIKGGCAYVVSLFKEMWGVIKNVFSAIADIIKSALTLDFDGVKNATKRLTNTFTDFGKKSAEAYNKAYDEEMAKSKKKESKQVQKTKQTSIVNSDELPTSTNTGNKGAKVSSNNIGDGESTTSGTSKNRVGNITTNIHNLINGDIVIKTTNLQEGTAEIKRIVIQTLEDATNDMALNI
jgi:TP901 family phage tail tape measure protein